MKFSALQKRWLIGAVVTAILTIVSAFLIDALVSRWVKPISVNMGSTVLSERSVNALSTAEGTVMVSSIFPKDSPLGMATGQMLRTFETVAKGLPHMALHVEYVDPLVNVAKANALKAKGAEGEGVLFSQSGSSVFVAASDLCGEQQMFDSIVAEEAFSAALVRLLRAETWRIGWVISHGEPEYATTYSQGYAGLQNALRLEGFSLEPVVIDTKTIGKPVPEDIKILMIVAPQFDFSMDECTALMEWVDRGGRLFVSLPASGDAGLSPLFDRWGIGLGDQPFLPKRTGAGGAGLTNLFSQSHMITRGFDSGVMATFVAPRALWALPKDKFTATSLVQMEQVSNPSEGALSVLLSVERDGHLAEDLIPTSGRIVIAGESTFFTNAYTMNRASINNALMINVMCWLADVPRSTAYASTSVLSVGQDNQEWFRDLISLAVIFPICFVFCVWILFRRHQ